MIEFQPNAISTPLMNLVVELVPLGGEHCQMLHVSPCQIQAAEEQHGKQTVRYFQAKIKERRFVRVSLLVKFASMNHTEIVSTHI